MPLLQGVVAHAMAMLRKKASSRSVSARSGAAAASRRWRSARDHLGDATGIVTEDLAVLSNQPGATAWSDAVCRCSQACQKSITSVSGDRVSRKVQLSAAPSAIATIPISGRARLNVCDFACKLRLQRELAALRMRPR